jgi:pimeloyl-ACP methyl ester carboxylesterase
MHDQDPFGQVGLVAGRLQEIRPGRSVSLAVVEAGPSPAATVFLCHGGGGNKDQWRRLWPDLVARGFRLVAWDMPGHGQSPQPRQAGVYASRELILDYQALFDRWAHGPTLLVGHSFGTRLTLGLLDRLALAGRLTALAGAVLLGPPSPDSRLANSLLARLPAWALERLRRQLSRAFRARAWHPGTDPALIDYEETQTKGNSLFMMKALVTQELRYGDAALARLTLPIAVVAGEADGLTPPAVAQALAARLPDGRFSQVAGAGHQIMLEQPAAVLAVIETILPR